MGYMKIPNLYSDLRVLTFKRVYALEKIHGTSAHLRWALPKNPLVTGGESTPTPVLSFFAGGSNHEQFLSLFNQTDLAERFTALGHEPVTVYGEAFGGKLQGMSHTYGKSLRFVVFDVMVGDVWVTVPNAADIAAKLGLDFVSYVEVDATVEALDIERDRPSEMARRLGIEGDMPREGIVIRPLEEMVSSNGKRVIAKHKSDRFSEIKTPRVVGDPLELKEAEDAVLDWVTEMRLSHVLDKIGNPTEMSKIPEVVRAMVEDIFLEGIDEVVDNKITRKLMGKAIVTLYKKRISKI